MQSAFTILGCLLLSAFAAFGETVEVGLATRDTVRTRLESGRVPLKQRQSAIRDLFRAAGCAPEEQPVDKKYGNVVCTLPGETDSTIIVGGHFDYIEEGQGIIDDWSGTSLLPSLYEAISNRPRMHTYIFVAFAKEETGLQGSTRFVRNLTREQKERIRAFVNLECLGLSPVKVWLSRSTPALVDRLVEVAASMGVKVQGANVDAIGADDDTHPFFSAHVPVLSIHSLTRETLKLLHSRKDTVSAIQFDEFYNSYKMSAYLLAYLDSRLE